MGKVSNFFKYNNIVPIAVAVVLLGAGGAFAATDPSAIYAAQEKVVAVDNTYIAQFDLSNYSPTAQVTSVTEDDTSYQVAYDFSTLDVADYVWKPVVKHNTLTVAKSDLKDLTLGQYVSVQIEQLIWHENVRLHESQTLALARVTPRVVSTTYSGLIGQLFDSTTKVDLPAPPPESIAAAVAAASGESSSGTTGQNPDPSAGVTTSSSSAGAGCGTGPLTLQILGNNPAVIPLHTSYSDLGVFVICPAAPNLGYKTFINGTEMPDINIDTSVMGTTTIEYRATDPSGVDTSATRTVIVE